MSKLKDWALAFLQHSLARHQEYVPELNCSCWAKQRRLQPGFSLLFQTEIFPRGLTQVVCLHQVGAAHEHRQPRPPEMRDEVAEPLGTQRAWTACLTWHLFIFFLGWKGQRGVDYGHTHLFESPHFKDLRRISSQWDLKHPHGGGTWCLHRSHCQQMLWHVWNVAQLKGRQGRREVHWGLLNTQKTQPAEEFPKLKKEVRRLLWGSILFAFPGFALPCLSLTVTAGDRILSWRRPWSDLWQLLWWAS